MKKKIQYKPLKKKRLYEEVAEQMKDKIFKGDIEPGEQLPSERELSSMFNVGRPTIREALRTLSVLGLIESNSGVKGYPVLIKMYPTQIPELLKANKSMLDAIKSRDPAKIDNAMKLHAHEELTQ